MYWKLARVLIISASILVVTSACARDRVINIGTENGADYLEFRGRDIAFPSKEEVELVPLYGATWVLSGNTAVLAQRALDNLPTNLKLKFIDSDNTEVAIENVVITFGDVGPDATTTYPQVALEFSAYEKSMSVRCSSGRVANEELVPVKHAYFSSDEEKKHELVSAYERMITQNYETAFVQAFKCLDRSGH